MARKMTPLVLGDTGKAFDDAIAQNFLSQRDVLRLPSWALYPLPDALASRFLIRLQGWADVETSELPLFGREPLSLAFHMILGGGWETRDEKGKTSILGWYYVKNHGNIVFVLKNWNIERTYHMKKKKINNIWAVCSFFAFFAVYSFPTSAEEINGPAKVIAGDLLEIDGKRVRLFGIDAPDLDQICFSKKREEYKCGDHARRHVAVMIRKFPLTCKGDSKDEKGALIAVCFIRWLNINENIVLDGWAFAYREHGDIFVRAEKAAKARHQGIWRGSTFVMPWEWRQGKRPKLPPLSD